MQMVATLPVDARLLIQEDVDNFSSITGFLLGEEDVLIVVSDHAQLDNLLRVQLDELLLLIRLHDVRRLLVRIPIDL